MELDLIREETNMGSRSDCSQRITLRRKVFRNGAKNTAERGDLLK